MIDDPDSLNLLADRFGPSATWSASQLESYAACPMAFFFQNVLGMEEADDQDDGFDARQQGSLMHRILQRFFIRLSAAGTSPPILTPNSRPGDLQLIQAIAREESKRYDSFMQTHGPVIAGVFHNEIGRLSEAFIDGEISTQQAQPASPVLVPSHFEFSFGQSDDQDGGAVISPLVIEHEGQTLRFRGRIDRIDSAVTTDSLPDEILFKIIDYKRSPSPNLAAPIRNGLHLQLPLYILAAQKLVFADKPSRCLDAMLRILKDPGITRSITDAPRGEIPLTIDEAVALAVQHAFAHVESIRRGRFGPMASACSGSYCPFRTICRSHEERLQRKIQAD
jgi:ATP-dependent helicase/DNAse subunit B